MGGDGFDLREGRTDVDGGLAADDLRGERGQGGRSERGCVLDRQSVLSYDVTHVESFGPVTVTGALCAACTLFCHERRERLERS